MKRPTSAFIAEMAKPGNKPRTLLVFTFPAPTGPVYISDGPWNTGAGGNAYLPLVTAWQAIDEQPNRDPLTFDTTDWKLTLANVPILFPGAETPVTLSSLFAGVEPLAIQVDAYHWFDGTADSDKLPMNSFAVSDLDYDEEDIELDMVSLIEKYESKGVCNPITDTDFPYATPSSYGKGKNIIYGSVVNAPCVCIRDGGYTKLVADCWSTDTKLYVSLAPNEAKFPGAPSLGALPTKFPFNIFIKGTEYCTVSGAGTDKIGPYFTLSARGLSYYKDVVKNGIVTWTLIQTVAVDHPLGSDVYEDRADFTYLVAGHGIKAITAVRVGGLLAVANFTTKLNDPAYYGCATVTFSQMFTRARAVSLEIDDPEHGHAISTSQYTYTYTLYFSMSYGYLPAAGGKLMAGNVAIWQYDPSGNNGGSFEGTSFVGSIVGDTLTLQWVPFGPGGSPVTANFLAGCKRSGNGVTNQVPLTPVPNAQGVYPSSLTWYSSAGSAEANATGIGLGGSSAADCLVGGPVTADVEGYPDDASGTYTGTPGSLIKSPIDVISHFIQNFGAPSGCCDSVSFSAVRASLATIISGGYFFAVVISNPVSFKSTIAKMAFQSRLRVWMEGTVFKAKLRTLTPPASQLSVTRAMMAFQSVKISFTKIDEIVNDLKLRYNPDWSRALEPLSNGETACLGLCDRSASYPVGGDPASVARAGIKRKTQWELMEFVPTAAMASDLRDYYIGQYKDRWLRINWTAFTQCLAAERFDTLDLTHDAPAFNLAGLLTETENVKYYPGSGKSKRLHEIEFTSRSLGANHSPTTIDDVQNFDTMDGLPDMDSVQ